MHRFNVASLGKPSPLYSHAAKSGGLLSIAGMLGEGDGFEEQWDIPRFNAWRIARCAEIFPDGACPPNTMLVVSALAGEGRRIELQAMAVKDAAGAGGSRYSPDVANDSPPGQEP